MTDDISDDATIKHLARMLAISDMRLRAAERRAASTEGADDLLARLLAAVMPAVHVEPVESAVAMAIDRLGKERAEASAHAAALVERTQERDSFAKARDEWTERALKAEHEAELWRSATGCGTPEDAKRTIERWERLFSQPSAVNAIGDALGCKAGESVLDAAKEHAARVRELEGRIAAGVAKVDAATLTAAWAQARLRHLNMTHTPEQWGEEMVRHIKGGPLKPIGVDGADLRGFIRDAFGSVDDDAIERATTALFYAGFVVPRDRTVVLTEELNRLRATYEKTATLQSAPPAAVAI